MRNPLSQIKNRQYRKWIEEKLQQGQTIDMDELNLLAYLQDKRVAQAMHAKGFSTNLNDYTWLNDLATIIELSITRSNPEDDDQVPGWARQDEILTAIYRAGIINKQHAFWVKSRHVKKGRMLEPLEDIIPLVLLFQEKETQDLITLYRNDPDVTIEITPDLNRYKTVGELNELLTFLRPPQLMGDFEDHVDVLGRVGEWKILFPKTMHGSMMCDPNDETTWCTVRKSGGNLFLSYVAEPDSDVSLYYIVSQDPQRRLSSAASWFSFGYQDGELELEGESGGISVDGTNEGLTPEILEQRFDPDDLEEIKSILDEHVENLGGMHPAKEDMIAAGESIVMFRAATDSLTKAERKEFVSKMIKFGPLASAVWRRILTTNFLKPENKTGFDYNEYMHFMLNIVPRGKGIPEDIFQIYFKNRYSYSFPRRYRKKTYGNKYKRILTDRQQDLQNIAQAYSLPNSLREFVIKDKDLRPGFAGRDDLTPQEYDYLYNIAKKDLAVLDSLVENIPTQELIQDFLGTKAKVKKYPVPILQTMLRKIANDFRLPRDFILTYPPLDDSRLLSVKIRVLNNTYFGYYLPSFLNSLYFEFKRLNRMTSELKDFSQTLLSKALRIGSDAALEQWLGLIYDVIKDNPTKQKMFREMILDAQFWHSALEKNEFMAIEVLQIPIILMHGIHTDRYDLPEFMPFIVRAIVDGPKEDRLLVTDDMFIPFTAFTPEELRAIQAKIGVYKTSMLLDFQDPGLLTRENIEAYSFLGIELFRYAIDAWSVDRNPSNENIEDGLPDWLIRIIANYDGKDKAPIMDEAYSELVDGSPWKYYFECERNLSSEKYKAQTKEARKRARDRARRRAERG